MGRLEIKPTKDILARYNTGNWIIRSDHILGDGGYWLNGATGIEVQSGKIQVCRGSNKQVKIGNFDVNYVWHDSIDAQSFVEAWDTIKQGNIGQIVEAIGDIFWDKILDMDYDVSIPFSHKGNMGK